MDLALELDLPVIIHSRDAAEITMEVMKEYATKGIRAVIHCYSYSAEMAKEFVKLGYYIGVGGVVTFKNGSDARVSQNIRATVNVGGNLPHNNMPPYITVYVWKRIR